MIQGNTVKTGIKKKYVDLTIRKLLFVFIKVMKWNPIKESCYLGGNKTRELFFGKR